MAAFGGSCQCSCGKLYDCPATLLMTGKRTHCGCKASHGRPNDISGQHFYRLTAEYMLPDRGADGSVIWHWRCDCGNEIDVAYNNLVHCNMKSYGCQKKEHDKSLQSFLTHVAGTSMDAIKSKKVLFDGVAEHYRKWKEIADTDPEWAEQNPVQVIVNKAGQGLDVMLFPEL